MSKLFLASYLVFLIFTSIHSFLFVDANLNYLNAVYTGLFAKREIVTGLYLLIIVVFFFYYFRFLLYFNNKEDLSVFKKILVATFIGLLLSYPAVLSYDIFNYILTAKVLYFYQENPYIIMPIEFTSDPLLSFTHATNKIALYGPFWTLISGAPFLLGFGSFLFTLFGFKLLAIFFYVLLVVLLYKMTKSIFKTSLFALNPLVIIETFISGHNDIIMMFFALLSIYFLTRKKYLFSLLLFFFSIFIKYATVFLLPVFLYVFLQTILGRKVDYKNVYLASFLLMVFIFFLSAFREEIYSWYSIWFLCFLPFLTNHRRIIILSIAFSIGMMLRYTPFMWTGSYFGLTPIIKIILMWVPVMIAVIGLKFGYFRFESKFKKR